MELAESVTESVTDTVDIGETINKRKRERDTGDVGRCVKQSSKKGHSRKRKFVGNQFTKVKETKGNTTPVSHKKVKYVRRRKEENIEGFRLFDMQIFEDIVSSLVCPECYEKSLYVLENPLKRRVLLPTLVYIVSAVKVVNIT